MKRSSEAVTILSEKLVWKIRLIEWIIPRLLGSDNEKERTLEVLQACISESHNEGIDDSADIVEQIHKAKPMRELQITADALRELARRNREKV